MALEKQDLVKQTSLDVSANGTSQVLDTEDAKSVSWIADLTALSGTSPTVTFTWQTSPDNTNWYDVTTGTTLTAAGVLTRFVRENLMRYVRIKWTVGGTITTATANLFIYCRR